MKDANSQWRNLEKETGVELLIPGKLLSFGPDSCPGEKESFSRSVINSFRQSAFAEGTDYAILEDARNLCDVFPEIAYNPSYVGSVDNNAGFLKADKALQGTLKIAVENGCVIKDNFPVTRITPFEDFVIVTGRDPKSAKEMAFSASSVIVCAGPWTNRILSPLGCALPLQPVTVTVLYWKYTSFPEAGLVFEKIRRSAGGTEGNHFYALPEVEYPGMVKICSHVGIPTDPDERNKVDTEPIKRSVSEFIKENLPGVETEASIEELCMYTVSPDEVHILDSHPEYPNIVFGAGFSGQGFKLGPVTGEFLADLAMRKTPKYPGEPFSADRFKKDSNMGVTQDVASFTGTRLSFLIRGMRVGRFRDTI